MKSKKERRSMRGRDSTSSHRRQRDRSRSSSRRSVSVCSSSCGCVTCSYISRSPSIASTDNNNNYYNYPSSSSSSSDDEQFEDRTIVVYTDGSCLGRRASGIGCYFGRNHPLNQSVQLDSPHKSGRAEIAAAQRALDVIKSWEEYRDERIEIRTDYENIVNAMENGSRGWTCERELRKLRETAQSFPAGVFFQHVNGHREESGNEEADRLARAAIHLPRSKSRRSGQKGSRRSGRKRSRSRSRSDGDGEARRQRSRSVYVSPRRRR